MKFYTNTNTAGLLVTLLNANQLEWPDMIKKAEYNTDQLFSTVKVIVHCLTPPDTVVSNYRLRATASADDKFND